MKQARPMDEYRRAQAIRAAITVAAGVVILGFALAFVGAAIVIAS